jgi:hypothetical protein
MENQRMKYIVEIYLDMNGKGGKEYIWRWICLAAIQRQERRVNEICFASILFHSIGFDLIWFDLIWFHCGWF